MKSSQPYQDRDAIERLIARGRQERDIAMGRAMVDLSAVVARWIARIARSVKRPFHSGERASYE